MMTMRIWGGGRTYDREKINERNIDSWRCIPVTTLFTATSFMTCRFFQFLQNGYPTRRRSLISDAKFETHAHNEALQHQRTLSKEGSISEDEVFDVIENGAPESDDKPIRKATLLLALCDGLLSLPRILKSFEVNSNFHNIHKAIPHEQAGQYKTLVVRLI